MREEFNRAEVLHNDKNKMATLLKTSRTEVDRLLDPKHDITLGSLQRTAAMVGSVSGYVANRTGGST